MSVQSFLAAVDNPAVVGVYSAIAVSVVAHMNRMYKGTPKIEVVAWWLLGVGSFAVVVNDIHGVANEWGHIAFGVGALILVILNTQPDWRPLVANRRKREEWVLPPDCDRRCATLLRMRQKRTVRDSGKQDVHA